MGVIFMGPLPPPVNGFSLINSAMKEHLSGSAKVHVFNVSPFTMKYGSVVARMLRLLYSPILFVRFLLACMRGNAALYMGFSGGRGQLFDAAFVLVARLFGLRAYIHHHSFAYINQPRLFNRLAIAACGSAEHVVLCDDMGNGLREIYGVSADRVTVLSNVAFMDPSSAAVEFAADGPVTLGYISNITAEKGIFEFLALYEGLRSEGLQVKAVVAGPVHPTVRDAFQQRIESLEGLVHLGPVYGEAKDEFFRNIDVMVFPTKYVNEAEPLVLWEAMGSGATVVSVARGCIRCSVPAEAGFVANTIDEFLEAGPPYLRQLVSDRVLLEKQQKAALAHFRRAKADADMVREGLVKRIAR